MASRRLQSLVLPLPDDLHLHLRDGAAMRSLLGAKSVFGRALVMPNLKPPLTTTDSVLEYRRRLEAARGPENHTQYLMNGTTPSEIEAAKRSGVVVACKLYPAGATTNSSAGVTDVPRLYPVFRKMAEEGLILCVHGEIPDPAVDIFDRERDFIQRILSPLVEAIPTLRVVFEHITTREAVDFVFSHDVAATITPQHLLFNRNHLLVGGVKPHFYCLPILKREEHRQALLGAIRSGSPKFFLGTDSAPHPLEQKESACGCAGCFSMFTALELYLEAFEEADCLEHFVSFASANGASFYGLPPSRGSVTLVREAWTTTPSGYSFGESKVVQIKAGETLAWRVQSVQFE